MTVCWCVGAPPAMPCNAMQLRVVVDITNTLPGAAVWMSACWGTIQDAVSQGAMRKLFQQRGAPPFTVRPDLPAHVADRLRAFAIATMRDAVHAGQAVVGTAEQLEALIRSAQAHRVEWERAHDVSGGLPPVRVTTIVPLQGTTAADVAQAAGICKVLRGGPAVTVVGRSLAIDVCDVTGAARGTAEEAKGYRRQPEMPTEARPGLFVAMFAGHPANACYIAASRCERLVSTKAAAEEAML